jgi:hypothetical protein
MGRLGTTLGGQLDSTHAVSQAAYALSDDPGAAVPHDGMGPWVDGGGSTGARLLSVFVGPERR